MTHEDCERPCLAWDVYLAYGPPSGTLTAFQLIEEKGNFLAS